MFAERRGVSDLVAFVLVFAVIVTSVGLVYTVGFGALTDFTDGSQSQSASRAFDVVTQRLGEIERGNTPAWRGEFDLAGGSIGVREGTGLEVTVNVSSGTDQTLTSGTGALVYDRKRTTLYYEGGALFRGSGAETAMIDEPPIRCEVDGDGPNRAVVTVVEVDAGGEQERAASGVVEIDVRRNRTELLYPRNRTGVASASDAGFVNVSVASGSPNTEAWRRYFAQSTAWSGDGPYSCRASEAYLRVVTLDVRL